MKNIVFTAIMCCFSILLRAQNVTPTGGQPCEGGYTPAVGSIKNIVKDLPQLPSPPPPGPPVNAPHDRLLFWVHGLGGDADSWTKAANATQVQAADAPDYPARKATCLRLSYSEFDLPNAGTDLNTMMLIQGLPIMEHNEIEDPTDNFVIAHSQGGIVSRQVDKFYADESIPQEDQMFGGIVTFGTAHQGARINNNRNQISKFSEEACVSIAAGPLEEWSETELQSNFLVDWIIPDQAITNVRNWFCSVLGETLIPIAIKDLISPIGEDYAVGAEPLAEINNGPSVIPPERKVTFYGTEEDPVSLRALFSLKVMPPNTFGTFQADYDEKLVEDYAKIKDKSHERYLYWYTQYLGFAAYMSNNPHLQFIPWYRNQLQDLEDLYLAYQKTYTFWLTMDMKYRTLIGASTVAPVLKYRCDCEYMNGNQHGHDITYVDSPSQCQDHQDEGLEFYNCQSSQEYVMEQTELPSDGVVLAESAMVYPGALHADEMPYSNHMQMRNDSNTKRLLRKLFDGGYDGYFNIERRQ